MKRKRLQKYIDADEDIKDLQKQINKLLKKLTVDNAIIIYRKISILEHKKDVIAQSAYKKQDVRKYYSLKD